MISHKRSLYKSRSFPITIFILYWCVLCIFKNAILNENSITANKSLPLRIIVPAPQVVQSSLLVPYIPAVPERVQIRQLVICSCQGALRQGLAPRVVLVLNYLLSCRIYDRYDVALQVVDVPI